MTSQRSRSTVSGAAMLVLFALTASAAAQPLPIAPQPQPIAPQPAAAQPASPRSAEEFPTGLLFASKETIGKIPLASVPLTGPLPPSVDLSSNFPGPQHQREQGSCVGWAVAYALKSYQERIERSWPWTPQTTFSAAWVYNHAKLPDAPSRPCQAGTFLTDALEFVKNFGAAPEATFPYNVADCTRKRTPQETLIASPFRIAKYNFVKPHLQSAIKGHLYAGRPVVIGMEVDQRFRDLNSQNTIYPGFVGPSVGGHAMVIVGYDDGIGAYKVINSWGADWGDRGFGWILYGVFAESLYTVLEAYVVDDETTVPVHTAAPLPKGTGVARTLAVAFRRAESVGVRSVSTQTGNHHCSSNCAGEPTRTPYTATLSATEGRVLRNPKLVCEGRGCDWSAVSFVRLTDRDRKVEAGWSNWGTPTVYRLEAEEVEVQDYRRVTRAVKRGEQFEVETDAAELPPQIVATVNGKELRVGPGTNAPLSGVVYVGRRDNEGRAYHTFQVEK